MRILFIVRRLPPQPDGVGDYTARIAAALAAREHTVAIVTSAQSNAEVRGATVWPAVSRWSVRSLGELLTACWRQHPDVVCLQFSPFMYSRRGLCPFLIAGMLALRMATRARVLVTFHELYNEWGGGPQAWVVALLHRLQFFALGALAHTLVFTTAWRCALARRWFFWKRPCVRCVPVGANVLPPASALPPPRAPRPVICTFGLLQRGVYFEELLRALAALVREEGVDVMLRVLGDWSGAEPRRRRRIKELVETLDLQGHVEWSGPQPAAEISRLLTSSDVYVCWRADGATTRSGTLAAALAHGLPVLANRSERMDVVLEERGVVMVFENAADLRRKCRELLGDEERRTELSRRARKFAESVLSWERIAAAYEEAGLDRCSAGHAPPTRPRALTTVAGDSRRCPARDVMNVP